MDSLDIKREIQEMDEYEFEYLVADLWELDGWKTTVSQASNDDGIDVTAVKTQPFDRKELIQAKRYSDGTSVGGPDIQQYASLQRQETGVDSVAVVTTSSFTQSAERMAENLNVKIVDGDSLVKWIETTEENILGKYVNESVSDTVSSKKVTEFTKTEAAEKIVDYSANQSDASIEKIDKLRKMCKELVALVKENDGPAVEGISYKMDGSFIDIFFEANDVMDNYYQIVFGFHDGRKLEHNLTGLSEEEANRVRSLAKKKELEVREDEENDSGYHIEITTENCRKRQYYGYYDVWIAIQILYEGFGIEFEDIPRAEHFESSSEFAWDEMSSSGTKSTDHNRSEVGTLTSEERARKLAQKSASESVTVDRLMGNENGFFSKGYLHGKPLVEYMDNDEKPRYFFYNESKGVRIDDEVTRSGWSGRYRNSMLLTNKGVHFFVGQEHGDLHEFLDHDSINRIKSKTGIIKKRLVFETIDETYKFPIDPGAKVDDIVKASNYDRARNI